MTRVSVFVDYQNVWAGARDAFGWRHDHFTRGQVRPRRLGVLLADRGRPIDPQRKLERVSVFRGEPSAVHSPTGQAACHRQVEGWRKEARVIATTRPLKYYRRGTDAAGRAEFEAREKGIDVLIALAMVMGARNDEFDVAVLMSNDTDLVPAIEAVLDLGKRCEVASWQSRQRAGSRLSATGRSIWCHWLDERAYDLVSDATDYTRPA